MLSVINRADSELVVFLRNGLVVPEMKLSPFVKKYTSFKQLASDYFYFASSDVQTDLSALNHCFVRQSPRNNLFFDPILHWSLTLMFWKNLWTFR